VESDIGISHIITHNDQDIWPGIPAGFRVNLYGKRIHKKNSKDQANPLVFVEKQLHLFFSRDG
jgi:hypothetical protein